MGQIPPAKKLFLYLVAKKSRVIAAAVFSFLCLLALLVLVFSLNTHGDPENNSYWIKQLNCSDDKARLSALSVLVARYNQGDVKSEVICKALSDSNPGMRLLAIVALKDDAKARGAIQKLVQDPDPDVRSAACFALEGSGQDVQLDSRRRMLAASRKHDPDFPRTKDVELFKYAHVGTVETDDGLLHVVIVRWRLLGMLSPRGFRKMSFFTPDYKYVGSQRCNVSPMICRGPYVLMWGSDYVGDKIGNAWDFSRGFDGRQLIELDKGL